MTVQKVLRMGDPILNRISIPITDFLSPQLKEIVKDMKDTMKAMQGVGLAAPQIGFSLRIVVFGFSSNQRYPHEKSVPCTVLINPKLEIINSIEEESWEGCLSIPGIRGLVSRPKKIRYSGYTENGNFFQRTASGFHSRIVQHEYDHLEGILFPMRIKNFHNFGFEDELNKRRQKIRKPNP
tara:strand:+ start:568 stop:1110 length:543 start_codon:yes stop_codon:yes gene_type:complete